MFGIQGNQTNYLSRFSAIERNGVNECKKIDSMTENQGVDSSILSWATSKTSFRTKTFRIRTLRGLEIAWKRCGRMIELDSDLDDALLERERSPLE